MCKKFWRALILFIIKILCMRASKYTLSTEKLSKYVSKMKTVTGIEIVMSDTWERIEVSL